MGQGAGLAHAFQANHRIRVGFAGGGEYRTNRDVVGCGLVRFGHLFWVVCGYAEPELVPDHLANAFRGEVVLAYVDAVEACRQTEVGAIVHDEFDGIAGQAFQFASLIEHFAGVAGFVAVLD